jgi:hypothetical protein
VLELPGTARRAVRHRRSLLYQYGNRSDENSCLPIAPPHGGIDPTIQAIELEKGSQPLPSRDPSICLVARPDGVENPITAGLLGKAYLSAPGGHKLG